MALPNKVRISALPVLTTVAGSATVLVVQAGSTYSVPVSLLAVGLGVELSVLGVDVSLLRVEVSAQASALASVSVLAAGIVNLTAVAGTDLEYEVSAAINPAQGMVAAWVPPVTNGGDCYLTWNGVRRRVRDENGSVLVASQLQINVRRLIFYDPTLNSFCVLGLELSPRVQSRFRHMGPGATIDFYETTETSVLSRIVGITSSGGSTSGEITIQVGTTAGGLETAAQFQSDGNTRFYGKILTAGNDEVYHPDNLPAFAGEDIGEIAQTVAGPGNERLVATLAATTTTPMQPTGAEMNSRGWTNVNNGWWDFEAIPKNTDFDVGVAASQLTNFYTGTTASFIGWASNVVKVTGPALVKVSKFNSHTDMAITAVLGTLAVVTVPSIPVYGRTWIAAGQSWIKRALYNGRTGIAETYLEFGGGANHATRIIDCAYGASGLFSGTRSDDETEGGGEEAVDDTNYYWSQVTGSAGPNAQGMLATILEWVSAHPTQPFPEAVIWNYGLPDLTLLSATGANTPAVWTQAQEDMQAWLDAALTSSLGVSVGLSHFICPLPARKVGVWPENKWYALRRAQLDVAANAPRTYRGPDIYDAVRMWRDGHHGFSMQKRWGARWPIFIENALRGSTHYEGPEIIAFTTVSAGEYRVRIQRGYVSVSASIVPASLVRPASPVGFALVSGTGADYIEYAVPIASYSWTTDTPILGPQDDDILRVFPETPTLGLRLAYPYGSANQMAESSRIVRDARTLMPLKTYHPTV